MVTIDVYDAKMGTFIDTVKAVGAWGRSPHSLRTRKAALQRMAKNKKANQFDPLEDPVMGLREELEGQAKKSRRARTKAAIISREYKAAGGSLQEKRRNEVISFSDAKREVQLKKVSGESDAKYLDLSMEEMRLLLAELGPEEFYKKYGDSLI